MRVTIFAIGTQGDVRPFVALGRGLAAAGHRVRIAAGVAFAPMIGDAGLEFAPLASDFKEIMATEPEMMARASNAVIIALTARRRLREAAESWVEQGLSAAEGSGLILAGGIATRLAAAIAEARAIPWVQAQLLPVTPAPDLPPVMLAPAGDPLPGPVNLALHHILRVAVWQILRPAIDQVRARLGLTPLPWYGPYFAGGESERRILYGFSAQVVPKPAAWRETEAITGYWWHDEVQSWRPPAELERFLADGPAPVYVGFGSMVAPDSEALSRKILGAVERSGMRAVIARGWGGLDLPPSADGRVLVIDGAPHGWLFPRMAVAVHHGGAGTTAAALRAGIPSVVVPFLGDQPFWGWRLERLGAAPPALPRARVTEESLAAAIDAARSPAMRGRAHLLGRRIRLEDGVGQAIRTLSGWGLLTEALDLSQDGGARLVRRRTA